MLMIVPLQTWNKYLLGPGGCGCNQGCLHPAFKPGGCAHVNPENAAFVRQLWQDLDQVAIKQGGNYRIRVWLGADNDTVAFPGIHQSPHRGGGRAEGCSLCAGRNGGGGGSTGR